ncbi:MAG: hypothetical protein WA324_27315 [Bryobacteraceae bacterium]
MFNDSLIRPTAYAEKRRYRTEHVAAALPLIADYKDGTSYAAWKVWSGSTTKETTFVPMPKKAAIRLYHKAVEWNRRGKLAGRHGGLIGSHVLIVLHSLIFDFLNHRTGRLDPSYSTLQRATRLCRQTIATALARLKQLGIINWIRRCREDFDADGRFMLRQETNAYAILPTSQWHGYKDSDLPASPHPSAWGACPPLPPLIEQACTNHREGESIGTIVTHLEDDPRDNLAAALAGLGRALGIH